MVALRTLPLLGGLAALASSATPEAGGRRPHVLLIFADDYGWGNIGVHRRGPASTPAAKQARAEVHTPNLDALIDAGILLDRHYAYKICSPSRSSLQSGRLAVHVNTKNTPVTHRNPDDPVSGWAGIPRNMTGMAAKLKGAGYRTHMVGKWDAGMATPEHTPLGRGYETWVGYFQHANDYWRKSTTLPSVGEVDVCLNKFVDLSMHNETYRGGVRDAVSLSAACQDDEEADPACYEEHIFKERALEVIRNHDTSNPDSPLFLFYAFHLLHTPLQVPKAYLERLDRLVAEGGGMPIRSANRRLYAAMTLYMDDAVGQLIQALKDKGMYEDTLIVFTSDNGGPIYEPGAANNHPLKGGKFSDWEGGVRTNAFVSGGFVPASKRGTSFSGVVAIADWYGTFAELAGTDQTDHAALEANKWLAEKGLPLLPPVDSVAQWGYILNNTNGRPDPLHVSDQAVLEWPWKLVTGKQVYSAYQGDLYPNCTTVKHFRADEGPIAVDFSVLDRSIEVGGRKQDKVTWVQDCGAGCLHNVLSDPTEHVDLAKDPAHGDVLARLQAKLEELNKGVFKPDRGSGDATACDVAIDHGGFYGPFREVENWYTPSPALTPSEAAHNAALKLLIHAVNTPPVKTTIENVAESLMLPSRLVIWEHKYSDQCIAEGPEVPPDSETETQSPVVVV